MAMTDGYSTGIRSWLTTVDHKRIAIMYFVVGFVFLLIAGVEGQLIRLQLATPERSFLDPDLYNQLFTMHGTTMVFFAGMPLVVAFFNFVVPLQIGARDVAFPRLNAFSFWVFLFGGLFLYASVPLRMMPAGGWFAYLPLTNREYSPGLGIDFYVLSLL
ncbi:MAG: cytochrome ubiquinol oxidase subunit I, partial [Gemmatimonadales bacterium]|nr:cytochrome ubiquinol oxidase subunit I [Gemmatimonadales bacterium]